MNRAVLREALGHPNMAAFLAVIDRGEHGPNAGSPDRYRTMFGGELFDAPPWEHPRRKITRGSLTSTAAGRGQFLARTWDGLAERYGFPDFSPECQDEAMVALILGRKALPDVLAGRFEAAIEKCNLEWASLPGSPYGQPTLTLDEARAVYFDHGGRYENAQADDPFAFDPDSLATEHYDGSEPYRFTPPTEDKMALPLIPIFTALLPTITNLIPALAQVFKPGSEVAQRNVAAATVVANAITEATASPNLQAAVEAMQADPDAVRRATAAVTAPEVWSQLVEVGGGIAAARKAAADPDQAPLHKNPAFLISLILTIMPFMLLVDVFYVHPGAYVENLRTQIVTAVLMVISAVGAFWLGTSFGSQRKTNLLAGKE